MVENRALPVSPRGGSGRLGAHWKGHAFLFESKRAPEYSPSSGLRLLLIFLVLEGIVGPRLTLVERLHLPLPPVWLRIPGLLAVALLAVRFGAGLKLSEIGLRSWREWGATERSYFVQVLFIANVVFALIFAERLRRFVAEPFLSDRVATILVPYLLWGFYQEVIYRGILQTELVRRWGPLRGILVSNCLFTFGPLHFYHFAHTAALPMFAGIFAIGLFFAILFWRSSNLWMVAVFHGIGNAYIDGLHAELTSAAAD